MQKSLFGNFEDREVNPLRLRRNFGLKRNHNKILGNDTTN